MASRESSALSSIDLALYADAQFASPYAMSVFVALHEKGLPFDLLTVDLGAGTNRASPFVTTSLTQRVPAFIHGDFALSESSAITEYLEDVFSGRRLYPTNPQLRARAR